MYLTLLMIGFACTKEDEVETTPIVIPELKNPYFPLKNGNYWVYEFLSKNPDGTISPNRWIDTLKVIGDTSIESKKYWMIHSNQPFPKNISFIRDSMGYLISNNHTIVLTPTANSIIYNEHFKISSNQQQDTIFQYWTTFPVKEKHSISLGNFNCLIKETNHRLFLDPSHPLIVDTSLYANIGPIQRSFSYSSGTKMIGTLIDYHLK